MIITIEHLEAVEGGTRVVALLKRPTSIYPPSKVASTQSYDKKAEAYEEDLVMMGKVHERFAVEAAEYMCFHLGDAELTQKGKGAEDGK